MRAVVLACVLVAVGASPLLAQREARLPRRPRLAATADTNDAMAYLQHAQRAIESDAGVSADAYYWASRLDPSSADALYGRRVATLMRRQSSFKAYMEGNSRTIFSPAMRANDSLYFRALQIDPFLHEKHERTMLLGYYRAAIGSGINEGEIDDYVARSLNNSSAAVRARYAAAEGRVPYAMELYTEAITTAKDPMYLYFDRGRLSALQGLNDAAITDYNLALEKLRTRDLNRDTLVVFYSSKALYEHAVGVLYSRKGDPAKAREAFGRAMTEDLSFFPAHLELATLALAQKDTATALSEIALAAELAPTEGFVQHRHGEVLIALGQHADAIAPLKKAIELEPFFASPHYLLAVALEKTGDAAGAKASYTQFLALAARRHPERAAATERLRSLGGTQ
jgi:tetratricopeptide (TPR) repeat protein